MLKKISHPNVIEIKESGQEIYLNKNGKKRMVSYVVLVKAEGGELFDYIDYIDEEISRYYFR
jgi:serine/threonine protein kinase